MPRQTRNSLFGRGNPSPQPTTSSSSIPENFPPTVPPAVPSVLSSPFRVPEIPPFRPRTQAGNPDEEPEENVCLICKEEYHTGAEPETVVTLLCGHRFGISCAHSWFQIPERNHACPLCNRQFYPDAVAATREGRLSDEERAALVAALRRLENERHVNANARDPWGNVQVLGWAVPRWLWSAFWLAVDDYILWSIFSSSNIYATLLAIFWGCWSFMFVIAAVLITLEGRRARRMGESVLVEVRTYDVLHCVGVVIAVIVFLLT